MLLYLEAGISSRPRWPCNPPPRLEVTDAAFALICFCSFLSVLKFGCPAILAIVFCGKKTDTKSIVLIKVIWMGNPPEELIFIVLRDQLQ